MSASTLDAAALRAWPLPALAGAGDKEARGRVVVVAGHAQLPGVPVLVAEAALRAGAGKVVVGVPASIATAVGIAVPESRVIALPETAGGAIDPRGAERLDPLVQRTAALVVGPGMQDEGGACALATALMPRCGRAAVVLDAAAMRAVERASRPVLVLPHAGEMAHLTGLSRSQVEADAEALAERQARAWRAVVALKGASTLLAEPDGRLHRHDGGAPALATAGSGDVLAGLVAGLAARGAPLAQAAAWGIVVHALAGRRVAARTGTLGLLARELAAEVPRLLDELADAAG